jgi:hypothetical protein
LDLMKSKDLENNFLFQFLIAAFPSLVISWPLYICPEVALSNCKMAFPNVDFPQLSLPTLMFLPHTV